MDWRFFWTILILLVTLLGWLACNYFRRYYALFWYLFWGSLALLVGCVSYDYGVYRGAWAVRDVYEGAREVRDIDRLSNGLNLFNNSCKAQTGATIPVSYHAIVAGFLMYCVLMLWVGGRIANNPAKKTGPKAAERDRRNAQSSRPGVKIEG
jgi:hypothetical protein